MSKAKTKTSAKTRNALRQEAHARLVGAFAAAWPFTARRSEAQKEALFNCGAFLSALAVGGGSETDLGALIRMNDAREDREGPMRARAVACVQAALKSKDKPWTTQPNKRYPKGRVVTRASNVRALLSEVAPRFGKLTEAQIEKELAKPGRRGPDAITACFSIACNAFGDRGSTAKAVTERYRKARESLLVTARRAPPPPPSKS